MGNFAATLATLLVNGVAYGMMLFLISVGLTITLGVMRVINLAHCAFAMIGGYFALVFATRFGLHFFIVVPLAVVATMVVGYVLERTLYRWVYAASELGQVLMTIGLTFILISVVNLMFGGTLQRVPIPEMLVGNIQIGQLHITIYRVFLLVASATVALALWLGLERTDFGARLRAAVDNKKMAACVGIDVARLFSFTFAIGCGLAALGGVLGAEIVPLEPYYGLKYLILVLIVVSVGGLGSLGGSLLSALLLGVIDTLGRYYLHELGGFVLYIFVLLLLLVRPQGLLGRA